MVQIGHIWYTVFEMLLKDFKELLGTSGNKYFVKLLRVLQGI